MFSGIRIYSSDPIWRNIMADLDATVVDDARFSEVNMDELDLILPITPVQLKYVITNAMDNTDVLKRVLGDKPIPSNLPAQIIVWLYKTGGMSASDLKVVLGYAPNTNTHTVDTTIYGLRREYGHDFIINENGIYKLGRI